MARLDSRARRDSVALTLQDAAWAAANKPPPGFAYLIKDASDGAVKLLLSDGSFVNLQTGGGGGAPTTATYITQTPDAGLSAEQAMSLLSTGLVKNATATGVQSIATPYVDYVPGNDWFSATVARMKVMIPALTGFKYMPAGLYPAAQAAGTNVADNGQVGGGIGVSSSGATAWARFTSLILTLPKTTPWAIAAYAKFPAPTGGSKAIFGIANAAASFTHHWGVKTDNAVSTTNFCMDAVGSSDVSAASSMAADTNFHSFIFGNDVTNLLLDIDGSNRKTLAVPAGMSDELMLAGTYADAALSPGVILHEFAIGYVRP